MVARQLSSYVVRIPKANIYRFGDSDRTRPVLAGVEWTVREGESWAVVGSGAGEKTALLEVKRDIHHSSTIPVYALYTDTTWKHAHIPASSWWTPANHLAQVASH